MKKILVVLLLVTLSISTAIAQTNIDNSTRAKDFLNLLGRSNFTKAHEYLADMVTTQVSVEGLEQLWATFEKQLGEFEGLGEAKSVKSNESESVTVVAKFKNIDRGIKLIFDKTGKIQGINTVPVPASYELPSYADPTLFTEKEVMVGAGGKWALPGTLTIPKSKKKFPAVVIGHGSGMSDRDGTYPDTANKTYKDLALGLASKGIAVLRYEKRTQQHTDEYAKDKFVTVREETIDDVLAAVELLLENPEIDKDRIYFLGHSLSGYLIPRINKDGKNIAGYISFAGATRPLEDTIVEQYQYIFNLDGQISPQEQALIDTAKQSAIKIKALSEKDLETSPVYNSGYPAYWLYLQNYDPMSEAKSIKKPFLILQGERDYNVTMTDLANWKKVLGKKKNVSFKSYPKLNHNFMPGEGKPNPSENSIPNHVAEEVINDIANWILIYNKN